MKRKNDIGITLIALVITIILLLILAGVVLNLALGENGIIKLAEKAGKDYQNASIYEQNALDKLYSSIKVSENSQITLTMEELDKYIEEKMKENLFTGTELIKDPVLVPTTTTWAEINLDFTLENSIDNYKFLLITFGYYNDSTKYVDGKSTLLISVDTIKYSETRELACIYCLAANDGINYSTGIIFFKDNKTICIKQSIASNNTRKNFGIESIKGIK